MTIADKLLKTTRDTFALLGVAVALVVVIAGIIIYREFIVKGDIEREAIYAAQLKVEAEMRRACKCWFGDSRCSGESAIVYCTAPNWLRKKEGTKR